MVVRRQMARMLRASRLDAIQCHHRVEIVRVDVVVRAEIFQVVARAEIGDQQKTVCALLGKDTGHMHTDLCEHAGDRQVGPDILACGWRVHGDECFAVAPNTEIAPKAGVARCRRDAIRTERQLVVQPVTQQLESRVTNEWISVGKQTSL